MSATKYYTDGHSVRFDNGSHGGIYCVATDVPAAGEICNKLNTHAELLEALEAALEHAYIPHGKPWLLDKIQSAIAKARN